jgi:2-dehydropantoate 2-reductase
MDQPSLLVVGTGAMACLFGARLAPHAKVTMLGTWQRGLDALRRGGIRWMENGAEQHRPVRVESDPAKCRGAERALVLVKSWQTARAAGMLADCLAEDGVALTLQNGLGNLEKLAAALGERRAALGVTTSGATLIGPGTVRPGGAGPIHLARHPGLEAMANLFQQAGFEVLWTDDVEGLLWGKLAVNAAINPLSALLGVPNGELLSRPGAPTVMDAAAEEVERVARALGIGVPVNGAAEQARRVAERTAANRSSMLQDIERGAPTEIDAICGEVVRYGERRGVPTPVNWTLWSLVRARAAGGHG